MINNKLYCFGIDIEHTGIKPVAIGAVLMTLDFETSKIEIIKEDTFYIKVVKPFEEELIKDEIVYKLINYGDFSKRCWDEYWNKEFKQTLNGVEIIQKPQLNQLEEFEALVLFMKFYSECCEIYNDFELVSDNASFDCGIMDERIRHVLNPEEGLNFRNKKNEKSLYRCVVDTGSFKRGLMSDRNVVKSSSNNWGNLEGTEFEDELKKCPYPHDHLPLNDAKNIVWKYLKIKSILYNTQNKKD